MPVKNGIYASNLPWQIYKEKNIFSRVFHECAVNVLENAAESLYTE